MSFNNYGPAIRDLQRESAFKLRRARIAYTDRNRPAQRYTDSLGRRLYRPWAGVTGGKWIKRAPVVGAKVKLFSAQHSQKE